MRKLLLLLVPALILATSTLALAQANSTVTVRDNAQLGRFLADTKGMTLYMFKNDKPNESNCYDGCARAWPPYVVAGELALPSGVGGKLDLTTRRDGARQVTYEGMPLYYWAQDQNPGDTKGQGVGGNWFVVAPQAAAAMAGPVALPRTGGPALPAGGAAIVGLLLVGAGSWLRRR